MSSLVFIPDTWICTQILLLSVLLKDEIGFSIFKEWCPRPLPTLATLWRDKNHTSLMLPRQERYTPHIVISCFHMLKCSVVARAIGGRLGSDFFLQLTMHIREESSSSRCDWCASYAIATGGLRQWMIELTIPSPSFGKKRENEGLSVEL